MDSDENYYMSKKARITDEQETRVEQTRSQSPNDSQTQPSKGDTEGMDEEDGSQEEEEDDNEDLNEDERDLSDHDSDEYYEDEYDDDEQSSFEDTCDDEFSKIWNELLSQLDVPITLSPQFYKFYNQFSEDLQTIINYEFNSALKKPKKLNAGQLIQQQQALERERRE